MNCKDCLKLQKQLNYLKKEYCDFLSCITKLRLDNQVNQNMNKCLFRICDYLQEQIDDLKHGK